ncbi:MAG: hypothetical protein PUB67_03615 [Clostridiales bacterium]|nr:hypothetical protein [Clostridiales bacterium]
MKKGGNTGRLVLYFIKGVFLLSEYKSVYKKMPSISGVSPEGENSNNIQKGEPYPRG